MTVKLEQITLAADNVEAVIAFYDAVFQTNLKGKDTPLGIIIYDGMLAGIPFQVCPNTLAEVDARQNRQQFQFQVESVAAAYKTALSNGGRSLQPVQAAQGMKIASVYDPDGNSIVLRGN